MNQKAFNRCRIFSSDDSGVTRYYVLYDHTEEPYEADHQGIDPAKFVLLITLQSSPHRDDLYQQREAFQVEHNISTTIELNVCGCM